MSPENGDRVALRNVWLKVSMAAFRGHRPFGEVESLFTYSRD